jgi:hypothetical protein
MGQLSTKRWARGEKNVLEPVSLSRIRDGPKIVHPNDGLSRPGPVEDQKPATKLRREPYDLEKKLRVGLSHKKSSSGLLQTDWTGLGLWDYVSPSKDPRYAASRFCGVHTM